MKNQSIKNHATLFLSWMPLVFLSQLKQVKCISFHFQNYKGTILILSNISLILCNLIIFSFFVSGLSSSRNHYGQRVITREADLVTAHEFGHNWGSEHDPDSNECSPSASQVSSFCSLSCSRHSFTKSKSKIKFNTNFFLFVNFSIFCCEQLSNIFWAHKFGHNWGSEHDPDSNECSPSASQVSSFCSLSCSQHSFTKSKIKFKTLFFVNSSIFVVNS